MTVITSLVKTSGVQVKHYLEGNLVLNHVVENEKNWKLDIQSSWKKNHMVKSRKVKRS